MNILVFTKNWLGDVIFETPAIRTIKENFPESRLITVTPKRCVEVLEANPYVSKVIPFDEKEDRGIFARFGLIQRLRKFKFDQAYLFHRSSTRAWIAYFAGAKERIGYDTKGRGLLLTKAVPEPESPIHDVQYFMGLLQAAGLRVEGDYAYEFFYSKEDERRIEKLLVEHGLDSSRLVAINPGANWLPKRWPPEYFRELAHRIIERFHLQIVLTGSAEDQPVAEMILNHGGPYSMTSLCGKTTVRELGALYAKCRLLISNDTGPLHIGSGVGTNVVGIFGPTAPLETAPLGRGRNVIIHYAPDGVKLPWIGRKFPSPWMELISADSVFETIEKERLLP